MVDVDLVVAELPELVDVHADGVGRVEVPPAAADGPVEGRVGMQCHVVYTVFSGQNRARLSVFPAHALSMQGQSYSRLHVKKKFQIINDLLIVRCLLPFSSLLLFCPFPGLECLVAVRPVCLVSDPARGGLLGGVVTAGAAGAGEDSELAHAWTEGGKRRGGKILSETILFL